MKHPLLAISAASSLWISTCGCGLVHVPYLQTLPSASLQRIVVCDFETGQPLQHARVCFRMQPWENFMEPIPFWGFGEAEQPMASSEGDSSVIEWDARHLGSGCFLFDTRTKPATVQIWFPLGMPLGYCSHNCYDGTIWVSAPGYRIILIGNSLTTADINQFHPWNKRPDETCLRFQDKKLYVLLPRMIDQETRKDSTSLPRYD